MAEIVDEVDVKDVVLPEDKQEDLFFKLITGKDVIEKITTRRGIFKVKYPKQKDLIKVARRKAALMGGLPAGSFDDNALFAIHKIAFLDVVVVSGDVWFENLKKRNSNFTWGDMPDERLIDELYVKAWSFRENIQDQLAGDEDKADSGSSDGKDIQTPVDDGVFSGIAGENNRSK